MSAPPVKRACDACHRRKVRCTGGQPCRNCGQASLQCTYNAIPQKKGPKGSRAKVISELRDTQQQSVKAEASPAATGFDFNRSPLSPITSRDPSLLTQQTIDGCIAFFFTHMYPTMPIFHRQRLNDMLATQRDTSTEVYCLVASMCAFVLIQPGMKQPGSQGVDGEPTQEKYEMANALIEDVLRVRKSFEIVDAPTVLTVQTSFFLFGSYFGLEQRNHAWFHLREASTVAQILDMHEESAYLMGDPIDSIFRRRTYWLLLLTERAYAMERHRPLTLHATIELPTPEEIPEEAAVIFGFLYLINLFRLIDDEFIGLWNKTRSECSTSWLAQLQRQLSEALPENLDSTESQAADIRVTQHWLRIMVWQLSIMNGNLSSKSSDSSMTFSYPIEVARDLIRDVSTFSQIALEVHGVGLIEKIFDVACTLTDVIALVPLDPPQTFSSTNAPEDYLNHFLNLISRLRGGASRFLPLLIAKVSENLPSMAASMHNMPLSVKFEFSDSSFSPSMSSTSASLAHQSPVSPYGHQHPPMPVSGVTDPSLMFAGYSPSAAGSEALTPSGTPHTHMAAPIPRSVPRFQFDGYTG